MKTITLILFGLALLPLVLAEDTTIKGDSMELVNQGEIVRFTGGVVLKRGTDILRANQMETSKRRDKVRATGQVELFRELSDGQKLKAFGDQGFFNTESGEGYLLSKKKQPAHVIYHQVVSSTMTRVMDVYAERFDFSQENSTGLATGQVRGKTVDPKSGDHFQFWSSSAAIDQGSQTIRLFGPTPSKLRQDTAKGHRTMEGDTITLKSDGKTLFAEGNARAVFVDEVQKKESPHGVNRSQR